MTIWLIRGRELLVRDMYQCAGYTPIGIVFKFKYRVINGHIQYKAYQNSGGGYI